MYFQQKLLSEPFAACCTGTEWCQYFRCLSCKCFCTTYLATLQFLFAAYTGGFVQRTSLAALDKQLISTLRFFRKSKTSLRLRDPHFCTYFVNIFRFGCSDFQFFQLCSLLPLIFPSHRFSAVAAATGHNCLSRLNSPIKSHTSRIVSSCSRVW
jgi:hypothetical protein